MNTQSNAEEIINTLASDAAKAMDYEVGWLMANTVPSSTTYKGKGRPKKSDYNIATHPFDGKINKFL